MTNDRVLSHLSIECVINQLDYAKRFCLSKGCPTIASLEKRIPLHIDTLHIQTLGVKINDTVYKLGISRHYHLPLITPEIIQIQNREGGLQDDVDKYGFVRSPGNVVAEIDRLRNELVIERERLTFDVNAPKPGYETIVLERFRKKVEKNEEMITRLELIRDNSSPTFTHYIQLVTTFGNGEKRFEHVVYQEKNLKQSKEYIMERLFKNYLNGRKIRVNHFKSEQRCFESLIQFENHPLKSLEFFVYRNEPLFHHAHTFIMANPRHDPFNEYYQNHRVQIKLLDIKTTEINAFLTLCRWQLNNHGQHFSVETPKLENAQEFYRIIKDMPNGRVQEDVELSGTLFPENVIEPQENELEIRFFITVTTENDKKKLYHLNARADKIE